MTSPESAAGELRKALKNRSNYIAAKAARIVDEMGLSSLIPDLLSGLDRFFIDPVKSDPQCWAKIAIVKALGDLGHTDPATYLRGLHYQQMEAIWNGRVDTAGPLRCHCALGLIQCRELSDLAILSHLIELLCDSDKTVRAEAARGIGRIDRAEAALLLRLRTLLDGQKSEEPEVMGACFSGLISIEGRNAFDFLSRFLDRGAGNAAEAALAIGMMRGPEAFSFLKQRWEASRDPEVGGALLTAIALCREKDAVDFLISLIDPETPHAATAIQALASIAPSEEVRQRIAAAVERAGNPRLHTAFKKHFR